MASIIRSPEFSKDARKLVSPRAGGVDAEQDELESHDVERDVGQHAVEETPAEYAAAEATELAGPEHESLLEEEEELITPEMLVELQQKLADSVLRAETAEQELAALRNELEELKFEAREQGYAAGYDESQEKVSADSQEQLAALRTVAENAQAGYQDIMQQAEDDLVETVFAAVARIIGNELVKPESVASVVRDTAKQVVDARELIVKLSSADYQMINDHGLTLFGEGERISNIRVVADEAVELGGCILETEKGGLDARLEVQLERLKQVLLDNRLRQQQARKISSDVK